LADSSDARHGDAGFFLTRRKKRSTRIEVSVDSSSDDPGRRVVLVDLISSGNDSGNNSDDDSDNNSGAILKTMRQVLKPSRMRFVLGPSHLH
jgi:hypothetical protein